ncbi:hypothetical protein GA0070622_1697 [Micromonospora sediminicola]|uniref:PH domain-containing protein n=1 Tax=Micromonospora sediminicola TaxID=946078 RepID=A0A1A9B6J4_9ACTN|nr:hypothetical protein [Micromonospora sediminicola]SBT64718.1 hypothetical protein GA0070622_1697 [Micromonospora sediminicola]
MQPGATSATPGDRAARWRGDGVGPRWSLPRAVALAFVAFLVACALWIVVQAAGDRDGYGILLGGCGAVLLAHLLGFLVVAWLPRRRSPRQVTSVRTPDGLLGVRFAYSRWAYYWLTALLLLSILSGGSMVLLLAATGGSVDRLVAAGVGALLLLTGWFLVTVLRLGVGAVTISPGGITHRGLVHLHVVPWHAVREVSAGVRAGSAAVVVEAGPSPDTVVRHYTGWFGTGDGREVPRLVVRTVWLATDPVAVLDALAFFHEHPRARDELADSRGLRRITEGRTRPPGREGHSHSGAH